MMNVCSTSKGFGLINTLIWTMIFAVLSITVATTSLSESKIDLRREAIKITARQFETFIEASNQYLNGVGAPSVETITPRILKDKGLLPEIFPETLPTGNQLILEYINNPININLIDIIATVDNNHDENRLQKLGLTTGELSSFFAEAINLNRTSVISTLQAGLIDKNKDSITLEGQNIDVSDTNIGVVDDYSRPAFYATAPNQKGFIIVSVTNVLAIYTNPFVWTNTDNRQTGKAYFYTGANGWNRGYISINAFSLVCPSSYTLLSQAQDYNSVMTSGTPQMKICIPSYKGDFKVDLAAARYAHVMGERTGYSSALSRSHSPDPQCAYVGFYPVCDNFSCSANPASPNRPLLFGSACTNSTLFNEAEIVGSSYPTYAQPLNIQSALGSPYPSVTIPTSLIMPNIVNGTSIAFKASGYWYHFQTWSYRFITGPKGQINSASGLRHSTGARTIFRARKEQLVDEKHSTGYIDHAGVSRSLTVTFPYYSKP
jgi:hypothetical protein